MTKKLFKDYFASLSPSHSQSEADTEQIDEINDAQNNDTSAAYKKGSSDISSDTTIM